MQYIRLEIHWQHTWEGTPITIPKSQERGQFHALEVMLIFVGWMLLLAAAWNHSAQITKHQEEQFLHEKAFARAQAQNQALIEQHHLNPWNGCAAFDEAKKRTRVHVIAKSCLERLAHSPPTEQIQEVYIRTTSGKEIFFEQAMDEKNCTGIERLIRVHETNAIALLGVVSCAE